MSRWTRWLLIPVGLVVVSAISAVISWTRYKDFDIRSGAMRERVYIFGALVRQTHEPTWMSRTLGSDAASPPDWHVIHRTCNWSDARINFYWGGPAASLHTLGNTMEDSPVTLEAQRAAAEHIARLWAGPEPKGGFDAATHGFASEIGTRIWDLMDERGEDTPITPADLGL
ncbi:MAG: hypothetical protein KDA05_08105 [Phycisphaerales bacterium]|nr:hypothetical protein [Phycisphaerales bacterium]